MNILRNNWQAILFCSIHCLIFLIIFQTGLYGYRSLALSGGGIEYFYSSRIFQGLLPYRDFPVEYPPIAIMFFVLPRFFAATLDSYVSTFVVEMLLIDLAGVFLVSALSKKLRISPWKTLIAYTITLLAIGPTVTIRYDLAPAMITLLSLYFLIKGHSRTAWVFLAIGTFTKLYPAILAPIFLIYQLHRKQKHQAIDGIAYFGITSAVIVIPTLMISSGGLWQSLTYHAQRGLEIESSYAGFLELAHVFQFIPLGYRYDFGSYNLISPLADIFAKASLAVMLVSIAASYWFFHRALQNLGRGNPDRGIFKQSVGLLMHYSIATTLVFMLSSKVFSAQYIIWIYPFVPLVMGRWRTISCLVYVIVGLMTWYIWPLKYFSIMDDYLPVIMMIVLRSAAMIMLALLLTNNASKHLAKERDYDISTGGV